MKARLRRTNRQGRCGGLFDLLVQRVPAKVRIVLLLLNALGYGLLIALREIAGWRFALFAGFRALEDDNFLHADKGLKGQSKAPGRPGATSK